VDGLAANKNWGRKGVRTRLLQTAERQARQHHYRKIALNVAQENEEALFLDLRLTLLPRVKPSCINVVIYVWSKH
jgi:GNAT superfamily N-acetyltransferase